MQRLANGGRVLELGIGTGRMALPLAARGVNISGVEASASMIAKLREKPRGMQLKVLHGDFVETLPEGPFSLVFALVSTFFLLESREAQQRCFYSVARELSPDGLFLLENYRPLDEPLQSLKEQSEAHIRLTEQLIQTAQGPCLYRARVCYSTPEELDEMAQKATLRLRERWSNWQGDGYGTTNPLHIRLYERR